MKITWFYSILVALGLGLTSCDSIPETRQSFDSPQIVIRAHDGITIHGEKYFNDLGEEAPLILLFHQGGSNGRGEYSGIAQWLNSIGYRAIAWDLRVGGEIHGESNRTVDGLSDSKTYEFCDASIDLQSALDYVHEQEYADKVIVWGSSFSAALVFELTAKNPTAVSGLLAFSPASGGPMVNCRARLWISQIDTPMLVLRPASEMGRPTSIEQQELLTQAGAEFIIVENGVHGSSTLLDSRTEADMNLTRTGVERWLEELPN